MNPAAAVPVTLLPDLAVPESSRDLGGLLGISRQAAVPFPLERVTVRASVAGHFCRTVVEQVFANPHPHSLEAVHIFPLAPDAAVTEMELRAGDVVVRAECRERGEAERAFRDARTSGHRAGLLTAERADVHTLRVTNIPAGARVSVRFVTIERLDEGDGALTWRFPTVIAPRYTPGTPVGHEGDGATPDTTRVPDASRLQPPLRLAGGTTLDLDVAFEGAPGTIECSQHATRTSLGTPVHLAPAAGATLDRDFVVRFSWQDEAASPVRAYTDGAYTLAVVTPPAATQAAVVPRDAVFVLDISGSMEGPKLDAGKRALKAALRGLGAGDRFRLIAFDDTREFFLTDFSAFDRHSLAAADEWIGALQARGGTEMLPALLEAFAGTTPPDRVRTVLFITDGQASNEPELASAVASHRGGALLFTVGIDTAVNESLLKRLARLGGGTCELLSPSDDIEDRLAGLEARLARPVIWDGTFDGGTAARPGAIVLFHGRGACHLAEGAPAAIRFTGQTAAGPVAFDATPARIDWPLGALWARERVAWLEDQAAVDPARERSVQADVIALATAHGIASRFTAFVAVEQSVRVDGTPVTVVQPVELPDAWDMDEAACVPASMAMPAHRGPRVFSRRPTALYCRSEVADEPAFDAAVESENCVAFMRAPAPPAARPRADAGDVADAVRHLVLLQDADGSFGGNAERTAAALLALLMMGHTTRRGTRRRVVEKAADWLRGQGPTGPAAHALRLLERADAGGPPPDCDEARPLFGAGAEGAILRLVAEHAGR